MDEPRVVRLSLSAVTDCSQADLAGKRFAFVQQACANLAADISNQALHTLVLLDQDDLAEGILEALLGIEAPGLTADAKSLAEQIRAMPEAGIPAPANEDRGSASPLLIVVLMAQPSLEAWQGPGASWRGWSIIKEKEFFLRLFESYRLGIILGGVDLDDPETGDDEGIASRLGRALEGIPDGGASRRSWAERRDFLLDDVKHIRELAEPALIGLSAYQANKPSQKASDAFMVAAARVNQFGKRPVADIEEGIDADVRADFSLASEFRGGSYAVRQALRESANKQDVTAAGLLARLHAYKVLRDCARWLGDGSSAWARDLTPRAETSSGQRSEGTAPEVPAHKATKPFKLLLIDEDLRPEAEDGKVLRRQLSEVLSTLFGGEEMLEIDVVSDPAGALPNLHEHGTVSDSIAAVDEFYRSMLPRRAWRVANWYVPRGSAGRDDWVAASGVGTAGLHAYDAIFCEVDYRTRFAGPQVVQKLASFLERTSSGANNGARPPIVVLTHQNNLGYVQQCLNLGASAFVDKDRILQIPSRLRRAVVEAQSVGADGSTLLQHERFGQHSNFRTLYSLRPDQIAALRSESAQRRIGQGIGVRKPARADGKTPAPPRQGREMPRAWDPLDRAWIQSLPKADLHCHLGTSIRPLTIEALAFNTCGHLFRSESNREDRPADLSAPVRVLIETICRIALRAELARQIRVAGQAGEPSGSPAEDWFRAMEREFGKVGKDRAAHVPDDPYSKVVAELARARPPVPDHMIVSLMVAVAASLRKGPETARADAVQSWAYLRNLGWWCDPSASRVKGIEGPTHLSDAQSWTESFVVRAARLAAECALTIGDPLDRRSKAEESSRQKSVAAWDRVRRDNATSKECAEVFVNWYQNVTRRIETAASDIGSYLQMVLSDSAAELRNEGERAGLDWDRHVDFRTLCTEGHSAGAPTLSAMVALPLYPQPHDQTLLRYLWGTGLLGAEHLQYPENLLLAAHDLVEQNAEDYVVYTELRCETPGYARAGMSAEAATDLLCAAFDLGAVYEAGAARRTFVRTNILLAAKRHKSAPERERVISLLSAYLSRRGPTRRWDRPSSDIPAWWQPAQVVGFDLSGNEAVNPPDIKKEMRPLIQVSSPITIHAGEAASAESVWVAVYEFHARRIGHGLRLRENPTLLRFCISEGICMEMCPISNFFTSDFIRVTGRGKDYEGRWLEHYPLRHFLESGLEVCINTDNRSLHSEYGTTLTDEYLWAARLSGGFTRWEVLKLIKASFKHAFLEKREVQEILQAVETWMFPLVANPPGLDWRPSVPSAGNGQC